MLEKLIEQLKIDEGVRSNYYLCTGGFQTIGIGRNVDTNPFSDLEVEYLGRFIFDDLPMTIEESEFLLQNDIERVSREIQNLIPFFELCEARQAVCINMAINLGVNGFSKFKKMITALGDCFYEKAALEMLNSRWASQVKGRAERLSKQMLTGEWQ